MLNSMSNSWENEHVPQVRDYRRFTEFDREPSGLKRLDLLVSAVVDHQRETRKDNLRIIDIGCGRRLLERAGFVVIVVRNWTFFFMQSYYLFLRLFTRRGSRLFRKLDDLDSYLADRVPLALGGGWLFIGRLRRESTE
jgi:hypothetical protein